MKGIRSFFFRLDIPRIFCFVLVVPCILFTLFTTTAVKLGFIFIPLCILLLLGCILKPYMPPEDEILKAVRENPKQYYERLKRDYPDMKEENTLILEAASTEKAILARGIGSRMVYPVCRTIVFYRVKMEIAVFVRDDPLLPGCASMENRFEMGGDRLKLKIGNYDENKGRALITLSDGKKKVDAYVTEYFKLKELRERFGNLMEILE
ncbi:MAG: hypothetical protein IJY04_01975 [Clostridia bacterium]|nr:hypothetical protein [Clostridia bacterium]